MAVGEYVSVHSQADTEQSDLERERKELKTDNKGEHRELAAIYVARGLDPSFAKQVAQQLMAHDALGAHARDELGISETLRARPIQAEVGLSWQLRCGSRHSSRGCCCDSGGQFNPSCLWNFFNVPRSSGRFSCARRWRGSEDGRITRNVSGGASHGSDRRRRNALRNDSVNVCNRIIARLCLTYSVHSR